MGANVIDAFSVLFLVIPLIWYALLLNTNFSYVKKASTGLILQGGSEATPSSNLRLNVLGMRCAVVLPIYTIIIYISLVIPAAFAALQILVAFMEGWSLYTFFSFLVVNMNGPDATVAIMQSKTEDFVCNKNFTCCCSCCLVHKDKIRFYRTATWWVWHAWWTRLALIIIATIAYYGGSSVVYILFSLLAAAILMGAVIIVINLYELVYKENENLNGLMKIALVKISVGQLVLLSIVQELLGKFGGGYCMPYDSGSCGDIVYATQRAYCVLMLLIFDAMSVIFYRAFAVPMSTQSTFSAYPVADMSFCGYFCAIFKFWDVMGLITYKGAVIDPNTELKA